MRTEAEPAQTKGDVELEARGKKEWEGVREWLSFSGTGVQEQDQALKTNLETFLPRLETIVSDYQTSLIEDEKAKKLIQSAKTFLDEAKKFLAENKEV